MLLRVQVEFTCGLVKMVTEKLHSDLMQLQYDDVLFTHTLDETLGFHRELATSYGYPSTSASVLSVLTQAQIFAKWINMERKCKNSLVALDNYFIVSNYV